MTMTKPTFTDEFKQGVVQYVLDHPDESKVAILLSSLVLLTVLFINGLRMLKTIMVQSILEVVAIMPVMKQKKLQD